MRNFLLILSAPLLLAAGNPATETEHVVEEGETLGGIANRAGVEKGVIAATNGLREPYSLRAGQVLQIPRQKSYTVRAGNTLGGIANRFGVPIANIAVANGLEPPYNVRAGQKLIIPAVVKAASAPPPTRTEPYFRPPHDGRILQGFSLKNGKGHDGIDYAANPGDMVRAAASGSVVFADRASRFGRLVVIDHGNGWRTRYGHLSRITVKLGDVVKTGERIGLAGDAGVATRPELHFEIMRNNKRVDPKAKLPQR